jgi:hypothetical protein
MINPNMANRTRRDEVKARLWMAITKIVYEIAEEMIEEMDWQIKHEYDTKKRHDKSV